MAHKPFPHPDGMASFWRSSPGELDDFRSTKDLPSAADIVIVGAGFSGGSLVTHLLASDNARGKSILVLEARELCSGATGRNGNLCSLIALDWWHFCAWYSFSSFDVWQEDT